MTSFRERMLARMGPRVNVPEPILAYLDWIDANNLARSYKTGQHYALLDPALENSCVGFVPPDADHASAWVGVDSAEISVRLVPFCKTGGDGSYAAFWVDEAGATQIVHLGSGSGSTMTGVMVSDPVDFLRLLAIGYDELCWPPNHGLTPSEVHQEEYPREDYEGREDERPAPLPPPEALRSWVSETFGVTIPERASEIIGNLPDMMDEKSDDPFAAWLLKLDGAGG